MLFYIGTITVRFVSMQTLLTTYCTWLSKCVVLLFPSFCAIVMLLGNKGLAWQIHRSEFTFCQTWPDVLSCSIETLLLCLEIVKVIILVCFITSFSTTLSPTNCSITLTLFSLIADWYIITCIRNVTTNVITYFHVKIKRKHNVTKSLRWLEILTQQQKEISKKFPNFLTVC